MGSITNIELSRPGFTNNSISIKIQAGENKFQQAIMMQPMNVRIQVIDQLTARPVPNISIKIKGIEGEIVTTKDPFQPVFDLVMGKTYEFQIRDRSKGYLDKVINRKITSNGQLIDVLIEPRPRYVNVKFTNANNQNIEGVKTTLNGAKILRETSDKKGQVKFKVYADTTYFLEYEFDTFFGSRTIYMEGEWDVTHSIRVSFKSNIKITASPGTPEIRIMDPSSFIILAKGSGSLTVELPFESYLVECDCEGGLFEKIITVNQDEVLIQLIVSCRL